MFPTKVKDGEKCGKKTSMILKVQRAQENCTLKSSNLYIKHPLFNFCAILQFPIVLLVSKFSRNEKVGFYICRMWQIASS